MKKKKRRRARLFPRILVIAAVLLVAAVLITGIGRILKKNRGDGTSGGKTAGADGTVEMNEAAGTGLSAGTSAAAAPADSAETGAEEDRPASTAASAGENADSAAAAASGAAAEADARADLAAADAADPASADPDAKAEDPSVDPTSAAAAEASGQEEPAYDHTVTELEEGREYLRLLDERSPVEVSEMIVEARQEYEKTRALEAYSAERAAYLEKIGEDSLWDAFSDYVILGDSRVVGFELYGYLSPDRVIAESGDTIDDIPDSMDIIRSFDPKYIFLSFGINDIGMRGLWSTAEEYADDYEQRIRELQEAFPDAEIYVNSILPATREAVEREPVWGGLPDYSEAVRQMCSRNGFAFIDNDALAQVHGDLYEQDGVHLQPGFYSYWGENQLLAVFDREHGYLTFRDPSPESRDDSTTEPQAGVEK